MGTFLKGITGGFSGKIGNVVGANWRKVDYMRSLPKPSKKAASAAQLTQRAKFALAVAFLSPIKDFLNLGFSDAQQTKSTGYNIALRHMLGNALTGEYPDLAIDFDQVLLSRGPIVALFGVSVDQSVAEELTLNWLLQTNRYTSFADDEVIVMLYNKTKGFFNIYQEVTREACTMTIPIPPVFSGDELVIWTILANRDGVRTSNSEYVATVTLA